MNERSELNEDTIVYIVDVANRKENLVRPVNDDDPFPPLRTDACLRVNFGIPWCRNSSDKYKIPICYFTILCRYWRKKKDTFF